MLDPEFRALTAIENARFLAERRHPEDFTEPLCDAPGYLDPHHRDEVSIRCALIQGHPGNHLGYMPAEWPRSSSDE